MNDREKRGTDQRGRQNRGRERERERVMCDTGWVTAMAGGDLE